MTENTLIIKKSSIERYELEIARESCCDALAPTVFAEDEAYYVLRVGINKQNTLENQLKTARQHILDAYKLLLRYMRSICLAVIKAEDYLIPASHLSFTPGSIFLNEDKAMLIFESEGKNFCDSIKTLLENINDLYPESCADFLLKKLPYSYDSEELYRLLTSFELDFFSI